MQGVAIMVDKKKDEGAVLRDRAERGVRLVGDTDVVVDRHKEMRLYAKARRRLRERIMPGDWPIDASTGNKADLDPGDVLYPLPDDMTIPVGNVDHEMVELRAAADATPSAFLGDVVQVDETVRIHRRAEAERAREARDRLRGATWTEELVEARIEEAFRVLFRASGGTVGPRMFGNAMPVPVREMSDLIAQAGNKSLRRVMKRMLRNDGPPSGDEVRRMDEALGWAMSYLREDHPDWAAFVNFGGFWKAQGAKVTRKCEEIGVTRQQFYRDRKEGIRRILEGLKRDGRAPT
jgi:hypothetical protein